MSEQPIKILQDPYYKTGLGSAYLGDSLNLLKEIPDASIDLICTSPPFALLRKKQYGNVDACDYIEWFKSFAVEFYRILKPYGSLAIDIGGTWTKGYPIRSLYHYELLIDLCKPQDKGGIGFLLAQELYWYNPAKLPTPAEWVTVRRERVKDAVNTVWWLSKDPHPKANNKRVLRPYSDAMKNLLKNGYNAQLRPSGHDISTKFQNDRGGAIPPNIIADESDGFLKDSIGSPILSSFNWLLSNDLAQPVNVISASNTASNDYYQKRCKEMGVKSHPARFPQALPEFIISLCTEPGDIVLDPFAGSNMTGRVAETLQRRWFSFEIEEEYLRTSSFRFEPNSPLVVTPLTVSEKSAKDKALEFESDITKTFSNLDNIEVDKPSQLNLFDNRGNKEMNKNLKFTYGHQFEPKKFGLVEILELCQECMPNRSDLEEKIRIKYFSSHSSLNSVSDNQKKLAMNCFLTLRAYKLIETSDSTYDLTELSKLIISEGEEQGLILLARHILTNLTGMSLLKAIEAIKTRGDESKLETIAYELQEMGYNLSPNAIYPSTMKAWLTKAGVFEKDEINWDAVASILNLDRDYIDELYTLSSEQKYFLLAMIQMGIEDWAFSKNISEYVTSVYKIRLTSKLLVKLVIEPLVELGLIESQKSTEGRGAKPHQVKLSSKAKQDLLSPLLASIADMTKISEIELNRSFEDVVNDLDDDDKHIKGKALELLAIWMIRLTSLRFTKWRLRSYQATGKGEVDVLAASDRFVYHRWQIQCKNTKEVGLEVLAKEVGMTFVTGADVVMIVTTGKFSSDAIQYAYRMMEVSRYYMVLIQREDIEAIKNDRTSIVQILDRRARRVFAKKELSLTDNEVDDMEQEEDSLGIDEVEQEEDLLEIGSDLI